MKRAALRLRLGRKRHESSSSADRASSDGHDDITTRSSSSTMDLREMVDLFEHGVPVKDRKWHARTYPKCFVGKEAVSFMVKAGMATSREDAVKLGRRLCNEYNLFEHVCREHEFKDGYLFYRFVGKRKRFVPIIDECAATLVLNEALMGMDGDDDDDDDRSSTSATSTSGDELHDLKKVAKALESGLEVKDRKWHLRTYADCFIGADAVDFLIINGYVRTRADSIKLLRKVAKTLNLFQHVTGDHLLEDDLLYYRFSSEEDRIKWKASQKEMSLEQKAKAFESGVPVKTHRYHMQSYPNTFVGCKAVDFIVKSGLADSRIAAVELGRDFVKHANLFHHVTGDHEFRDDWLFYRFADENDRVCISPSMMSLRVSGSSSDAAGISLETIGEIVRNGITVKDIQRGKKVYRNCFVAADAVSFMVDSSLAETRREAVVLGRTLENSLDLFEYVSTTKGSGHGNKRPFSDDQLLFRFSEKNLSATRTSLFRGSQNEQLSSHSSALSEDDTLELADIAEIFRKNIIAKDRRWNFKTYKQCFVGKHAVDFLVVSKLATSREDAVRIGRDMMHTFDLFRHVASKHQEFEDQYLYYRFNGYGPIRRKRSQSSLVLWNQAELKTIAKAFEQGVKVSDNRSNLRMYRGTFTGKDAVTFLLESGSASTRGDALEIGRSLAANFNLFHNVSSVCSFAEIEPGFECKLHDNEQRIYRFTKVKDRWYWDDDFKADDALESPVLDLGVSSNDDQWAERVRAFERNKLLSFYSPSRASLIGSSHHSSRRIRWASEFYRSDPRYKIFDYFADVAQLAAMDVERFHINIESIRPLLRYLYRGSVFTVWRPTSGIAIRRMMMGEAVGKGLDIKGKSAQRGKLSGFVPFLQISENAHKKKVRPLPKNGTVRLFFPGGDGVRARDSVSNKLESVATDMLDIVKEARRTLNDARADSRARKDAVESMMLDMVDPSIVYIDDYAPTSYGLEFPLRLFWEAFVIRQNIDRRPGSQYDGGRPSQPAFQDMNIGSLQAPRTDGKPTPVLIQNDRDLDPFNPFELLMAYEENGRVLPVVSDFDSFLVGTRGVAYTSPLPSDQVEIMKNSLNCIEAVLGSPPRPEGWTSRWIEVLKTQTEAGYHPVTPRFGFGCPKSIGIVQNAAERLAMTGAVRHGSECFNYYFPQQLDEEFLVIYDSPRDDGCGIKWEYVDVNGLQQILKNKIDDGFCFPLNPKWVLCDPGWYCIYEKLLASKRRYVQESLNVWFPPESGVREQIERIHLNHPDGFQRRSRELNDVKESLSHKHSTRSAVDLAIHNLIPASEGEGDRLDNSSYS